MKNTDLTMEEPTHRAYLHLVSDPIPADAVIVVAERLTHAVEVTRQSPPRIVDAALNAYFDQLGISEIG